MVPLIYDVQDEMYTRNGIHFLTLCQLESLSLIRYDPIGGVSRQKLGKQIAVHYYGAQVVITFTKDDLNQLEVGHVILIQAGIELALVCNSKPVDGFYDYICDRWPSLGGVTVERMGRTGAMPITMDVNPLA